MRECEWNFIWLPRLNSLQKNVMLEPAGIEGDTEWEIYMMGRSGQF